MAERQGLELRKSRRRDPRAIDYGRWYIVDVDREIEAADDVATESFTAHRRALEIARAEFVVKECDDLDAERGVPDRRRAGGRDGGGF